MFIWAVSKTLLTFLTTHVHAGAAFVLTLKSCFDAAILVWQEPNMNLWDLINQWNECRGQMHYDVAANRAARSSPSTATLNALAKVAWIALSRSSPWMNLVLRCQQHWELFCVSSRNLGYLNNTQQPPTVKAHVHVNGQELQMIGRNAHCESP